jgi:hypothetical protein
MILGSLFGISRSSMQVVEGIAACVGTMMWRTALLPPVARMALTAARL